MFRKIQLDRPGLGRHGRDRDAVDVQRLRRQRRDWRHRPDHDALGQCLKPDSRRVYFGSAEPDLNSLVGKRLVDHHDGGGQECR
jgi:hypothetical protein